MLPQQEERDGTRVDEKVAEVTGAARGIGEAITSELAARGATIALCASVSVQRISFLRAREGWRLAPAFDMNPARAAHRHSLSLDGRSDDQDVLTAFATPVSSTRYPNARAEGSSAT